MAFQKWYCSGHCRGSRCHVPRERSARATKCAKQNSTAPSPRTHAPVSVATSTTVLGACSVRTYEMASACTAQHPGNSFHSTGMGQAELHHIRLPRAVCGAAQRILWPMHSWNQLPEYRYGKDCARCALGSRFWGRTARNRQKQKPNNTEHNRYLRSPFE